MIDKKAAVNLSYGQTIYLIGEYNADGTPVRWRINGKVKTWKTRPSEFRVPIKHVLYSYGYLDDSNAKWFALGMIEQVCATCKTVIGWKDACRVNNCDEKSHTYCDDCVKQEYEKIERLS